MLKRLLLFLEQFDGGMSEIRSRDVDFLENGIPSIREIEKDLKYYELEEASAHITLSSRNKYFL